jgi:hypothetical protein
MSVSKRAVEKKIKLFLHLKSVERHKFVSILFHPSPSAHLRIFFFRDEKTKHWLPLKLSLLRFAAREVEESPSSKKKSKFAIHKIQFQFHVPIAIFNGHCKPFHSWILYFHYWERNLNKIVFFCERAREKEIKMWTWKICMWNGSERCFFENLNLLSASAWGI